MRGNLTKVTFPVIAAMIMLMVPLHQSPVAEPAESTEWNTHTADPRGDTSEDTATALDGGDNIRIGRRDGTEDRNIPLINESLPAIGWSKDIRLTNDSGYSVLPDIAYEGRNIHVVWENYSNVTGEWKYNLMYKRSTDDGLSWDDGLGNIGMARQLVDLGDLLPLVSVRMGMNGSSVHVAYYGRHGNFWWPSYMNSTNNGETWSEPRMIGNKTDGCPGALDMAVYGSNIHIAWLYGANPLDFQLHYSMSSDGGVSWSNATKMTSILNGLRRPNIAVDGSNVHIGYTEMGQHAMYYRRSLDNGKTWDDGLGNVDVQRLVFSDPTNLSLGPGIAANAGRIHVAWDSEIPHSVWNESEGMWFYTPYYQMLYMNSEDNGGNWSDAKVLVDHTDIPFDTWGDEPYGHVVSVWEIEALGKDVHVFSCDTRDDKSTCEIYYKKSDDGGLNWTGDIRLTNATGNSYYPRAGIDDRQIHVVWMDKRDDNNPFIETEDEIYYKRYPALDSPPPPPPTNQSAQLEGFALEHVNISWEGPMIGGNGFSVHHFDILYSEVLDWGGNGYSILASVQASNESFYYYLHECAGEGDPKDYFYYVCAVSSTNLSSCTFDQVGKFTRPLSKDPNLISIPLVQSNESMQEVLQTVKYDKAWYYDSFSQEWKWYMAFKDYRRGLWNIDHTMGVWVNVTHDSNLTVAGIVPTQTTIHLHEGWNLVSFPSFNTSCLVSYLKADIGATRVEGYDISPPYHLGVLEDFEVLQAGYAYWVRVEASVDWIVHSF
ncbi:MAG: exo-alpha-sialidase [Thermoplasmata archaeon]|nr:exo-alpha-sialidase [Thermoplasmata archaeon]